MTAEQVARADQTADGGAPQSAPGPASTASELVIRPRRGWVAIDWAELWRQRELLAFLVWRDVKVRYKQTVLGVAWVVIQPLVSMVLFTLIFGRAAGMTDALPAHLSHAYAVFIFVGLVPWQLFATGVQMGGMSLVNQQHLLTKVYFPRMFVPASAVMGALFDTLINLGVLGVLMMIYGVKPTWGVLLLPLLLVAATAASLGAAMVLAALTVSYRDFRFVVPFLVQLGAWLSFVFIPTALIPQAWVRWLAAVNPMFGIIDATRAVVLGTPADYVALLISLLSTAALLLSGMYFFRRTERRFADIA